MAKIQGHLTLIGDKFDIQEVTNALNHSPTWVKNSDDILGNGRRFGHCEWGVSTEVFESYNFAPVTDALIKALSCPWAVMAQLAQRLELKWHILFSIEAEGEIPCITLSPLFSKFASEIDAEIGFDIIN